jgi:hypothetical protein
MKGSDTDVAWDRVDRLTRNKLWVMDHVGELRSSYPDKYVAYDEGQVLVSADTPDEVFRLLRKKDVQDIAVVAIEFVSKEPVIWLH